MRREGRVRGKPSSKSRFTGRMRRKKRSFAANVSTNPAIADIVVQPPLTQLQGGLEVHGDERWRSSEGDRQPSTLAATVNGVIEAAFAKLHDGYGDDCEMEETMAMACTTYEFTSGAAILVGDGTDIAAIESAFQSELGIFENAVEGSSFSQFVRKIRGSALSEESWSDVDLMEEGDSAEDDWFMVDVG